MPPTHLNDPLPLPYLLNLRCRFVKQGGICMCRISVSQAICIEAFQVRVYSEGLQGMAWAWVWGAGSGM